MKIKKQKQIKTNSFDSGYYPIHALIEFYLANGYTLVNKQHENIRGKQLRNNTINVYPGVRIWFVNPDKTFSVLTPNVGLDILERLLIFNYDEFIKIAQNDCNMDLFRIGYFFIDHNNQGFNYIGLTFDDMCAELIARQLAEFPE